MVFDILGLIGIIITSGVLIITALATSLLYIGIDRKLAARFQSRIGPPITQPIMDILKLLSKETVIPRRSVKWLYNLMPVIALTSVLMLLLYVPLFDTLPLLSGKGDLVVVIYLIILPSIAMVIAGFSSGNNYASIGAQRKMIMMMSYELPLAVLIISIAWKISSFSYQSGLELSGFSFIDFSIVHAFSLVGPIGLLGFFLLLITSIIALCAEVIKGPFDNPEADTELAGGLFVDYSGRNLALFILTDAAKLIAFTTLIIGVFFPFSLSELIGVSMSSGLTLSQYTLYTVLDVLFFILKFFIIAFIGLTFTRVAFARLKITQATRFFWVISGGISLIGLLLVYVDGIIF